MDPNELRRTDFNLTDDQFEVQRLVADFLEKHAPLSRARAAEPTGFDRELWESIVELGVSDLALEAVQGGEGSDASGIVEMSLVAEELGKVLAPVPLVEHLVALRAIARSGDPAQAQLLEEAATGARILGVSHQVLDRRRLVSTASVASDIVGFDGHGLIIVSSGAPRAHVPNQASLPAAWVDPSAEVVTRLQASDARGIFAQACAELKVLAAARLVGLTEAALSLAVEFVKTRSTMGILIGVLQGIAFPLADVHIGIVGVRNLTRRAAWFLDHEPGAEPWLPESALVIAGEVAVKGTTISQHAQGGLGFTVEADASLYFLRAKGWSLAAGNVGEDLRAIAEKRIAAAQHQLIAAH